MDYFETGFDYGKKGINLGTHDYAEDLDDEDYGVKDHNDATRKQVSNWSKDDYRKNYADRDTKRLQNKVENQFNMDYPQ